MNQLKIRSLLLPLLACCTLAVADHKSGADWEIQDGELWIGYDEPCDTGLSVDCPGGFVTTFVQYPQPAGEAGSN